MKEIQQLPKPTEGFEDATAFRPEPLAGECLRFHTGSGRIDMARDPDNGNRLTNIVFGTAIAVAGFSGRRLPYQISWALEKHEPSSHWIVTRLEAEPAETVGATYFPSFEFGKIFTSRDEVGAATSFQRSVHIRTNYWRETVAISIASQLPPSELTPEWGKMVWSNWEALSLASARETTLLCPSLSDLWLERSRFDARAIFMRAPFYFDATHKDIARIQPIDWETIPLTDPRRLRLESFADNRRPAWRHDPENAASQVWLRCRPTGIWYAGNCEKWKPSETPSWTRAFDVDRVRS